MSIRFADPRPESSELQSEGPTPARLWGDQWLRVSEKVLKGLTLDLTDRVAALAAMAVRFESGGELPPDALLTRSLSQEIGRLNHLMQLFRIMPAEPFLTTEPVRLQDVIPQVLELHRHHADLRDIPVDVQATADAAPVLVRPSALLRCLLVLLESAAGNALRSGHPPAVTVSIGGDATRVFARLEGPAPKGTLLFTGDGSLVHAVRTALAHAHGTADTEIIDAVPSDRLRYEVSLPTLSEARRVEREGRP
jgi:hypothetical protein